MGPERLTGLHSWNREGGDLIVSFTSQDGRGRSIKLAPKAATELASILPHHLRKAQTVTVLSSQAGQIATGSTALVLQTRESGPIAFAVDAKAIADIRAALAKCEAALDLGHGTA
jgi:hypothetical protein